jgi:beta-xylosidase
MPKSGNWFSLGDPDCKELSRGPSKVDDVWVEAAYIIPKELYGTQYYFFACCSGINSTYEIHVGRSTNPLGPYLNKDGVDMMNFDDSTHLDSSRFVASSPYMIGPGHMAHYRQWKNKQDITTSAVVTKKLGLRNEN